MAAQNTVEIKIPCQSEFVGVVRLAVSGIASRMNFSVEDIEDIKIAVSEACTNCVQHAFPNQADGSVLIECRMTKEALIIDVIDSGKGFDPKTVKSEKLKSPSNDPDRVGLGLGLTFIKSLMDKAEFISAPGKGTTIRMTKHAPSLVEG